MGLFSSIGKGLGKIAGVLGSGSAIGKAVGSILGGPIGTFGGFALDALGRKRAQQTAFGREDTRIQRLVADAKAAGIHPLAALGSPASSSYGTPIGSTSTGDAIGDALRTSMDRDLADQQGRLVEAQIGTEKAKAQALLAEARSRSTISQARRVGTDPSGPIPLWVQYRDRDGNLLWGPNPDIPDLEQMPVPGMIHGTDIFVGDAPPPSSGRNPSPGVLVPARPQPGYQRSGGAPRRPK